MLGASVLVDSAVEHYRGSFDNPGMYTPLVISALTLAAGIDGASGQWLPRRARDGVYAIAGAVGGIGVGRRSCVTGGPATRSGWRPITSGWMT